MSMTVWVLAYNVEGQLVGALTMDALAVGAFDHIDPVAIETFAALTAATLHN